ncbi:MAG: recombinase family protein [Eubacteriales bacterium]|nr:recombinase family protein [Eubacteriales bacterium]
MRSITKIEQKLPEIRSRKRVAAYARVSMESERMNHSLSAQISYYNSLIQKNPDWEFAGVYADNGISGTSTAKRDEFRRMVEDCEAGKIDIILTKSIQRFARNTVDLLETVRHLKDLGIEVRFEKENIHSLSGDGELMLSILASFAQEESRSLSENIKWATRKRFEQGIPNGKFNIYGYRWEDEQLVIVPEEAAIVKRIFQNFLDGRSRLETERELEAEGIRTRNGCVMRDSNLAKILTNITYTGNMLLQKEFITDPIHKQRKKNRGELPQYWVEDTHEAIIDLETFQFVQEEMKRRKELGALANKSLNISCFTGKIKCPFCNQSYMHNKRKPRTPNGKALEYWCCGSRKKKGGHCEVGASINQSNMEKVLAEVLGTENFDEEIFLEQVEVIFVPKQYTLEIHLKDGTVVIKPCRNTGHKDCWTKEYRERASKQRREKNTNAKGSTALTSKLKCKACGCNFRRCTQLSATTVNGKQYYWRCAEHKEDCRAVGMREDILKPLLARAIGEEEWSDTSFAGKVDHIDVEDNNLLRIFFKDGHVKEVTFIPPKRGGRPCSEEQKEHMRQVMKEKWTPERKEAMSKRMKQIRSEKYWASKRK